MPPPACAGMDQRGFDMTTTIMQLVDRYCLFHVLRETSRSCYECTAIALQKQVPVAQTDISLITMEMLLRFRAEILKNGRSPVSFNTHRTRLRSLFSFAVQDGLLNANPIQRVGLAPVPERRCKTISTEATRLLISHIAEDTSNDRVARFWIAVTKTLYYTGIRRRQLVGLHWGDINFDGGRITLRAEASKTRREWDIPLPDLLVADLKWLLEERRTASKVIDPEQKVFDVTLFRPKARPLSGPGITAYYGRLGAKLGMRVSPHRFRHSLATTIVNATGNIRVVQELLGHADVKTTCIYIHPNLGVMRSVMDHVTPLG
jgi:integrase